MRSGNNYTTGVSENVRYLRCTLSGHPQPVCQKGYFVLLQEQYHDGIDYYVEDNLKQNTGSLNGFGIPQPLFQRRVAPKQHLHKAPKKHKNGPARI